ncbi:hypothetical protein V6N13_123951 [Hibiscus sabdariffa]
MWGSSFGWALLDGSLMLRRSLPRARLFLAAQAFILLGAQVSCLCFGLFGSPALCVALIQWSVPLGGRFVVRSGCLFSCASADWPGLFLGYLLAPEGPPVRPGSNGTNASIPDPVIPTAAAPMARSPPAPAEALVAANPRDSSVPSETAEEAGGDASPELDASDVAADRSNLSDAPYDPMVHTETSDMLEEALEISRDYVLLADLTGAIQANGEDLVNKVVPEAADSIIREDSLGA